MKIPSLKNLTIKVTISSILAFFLLAMGIMFVQFIFVQNEQKKNFQEWSQKFFAEFEWEKILEKMKHISAQKTEWALEWFLQNSMIQKVLSYETMFFLQNFAKNIMQNVQNIYFDDGDAEKEVVFNEVLVYQTENRELLAGSEFLFSNKEKEKLFAFSENTIHTLEGENDTFLIFRKNIGEYSVFYFDYFPNFWQYYAAIFYYGWYIFVVLIIVLFGVSYYFSRLVVRPIREQNISLAMYNYNLAHEIKTPLAVIRSNFDMFDLTKNTQFIESSKEELHHIEHIADSLLFLINKPKNQLEKNFIHTDIVEIIHSICEKIPHLRVEKCFEKRELFQKIDVHLFMSLIQNIVKNAEKYSADNTLKITITEHFLLFENPIFETFSRSQLRKIEEIFYQNDNSRNSDGYGLGIPIMRKIVEIFDWKMTIFSKNKTFSVKIFF